VLLDAGTSGQPRGGHNALFTRMWSTWRRTTRRACADMA